MLGDFVSSNSVNRQLEEIKKGVEELIYDRDGRSVYRYFGYVYPEVIKYLKEEEGIASERVGNNLNPNDKINYGVPIYIFYPDPELTKKTMKKEDIFKKSDINPYAKGVPGTFDDYLDDLDLLYPGRADMGV